MCEVGTICGLYKDLGMLIALNFGKLFGNSSETVGSHDDEGLFGELGLRRVGVVCIVGIVGLYVLRATLVIHGERTRFDYR